MLTLPRRPAGNLERVIESETADAPEIWTIGHWTCPEDVFLRPLLTNGIELIVDVRSQAGSRRSPQFGRDVLPSWLAGAGIDYVHVPELGGRRPKQDVDPQLNAGWQNASFKNYADYTLTDAYAAGVDRLTCLARERRAAILCGEPMPWRCHRSLIANTLVARGWRVWHLIDDAPPRLHQLGQWGAPARVGEGGRVTYPAGLQRANER